MILAKCSHIEVREKSTLSLVQTIEPQDQFEIYLFTLSPDERWITVTSRKSRDEWTTRLYDTANWNLLREWDIDNAFFVADGGQLASGFRQRRTPASRYIDQCGVAFYDINTGQKLLQWIRDMYDDAQACPDWHLFFRGPQSSRMVTSDFGRSAVIEWDAHNGALIQQLGSKIKTVGPAPNDECMSLSYDGNLVAIVWLRTEWGAEYGMTIWDLRTGKAVYELPLPEKRDPVLCVQFSSDGSHIAFVHSDRVEIFEYDLPPVGHVPR
jgi:WD40 repeat protein